MHQRGKKSGLNRVSGTVVGTTVWQTGAGVHTVPTRSDPGERARTASWNVEQTKSPGSWLARPTPHPGD